MAVAPVEWSQETTTENSTLPAVEASEEEEEEVDTFLQVTSLPYLPVHLPHLSRIFLFSQEPS